MKYIEVTCNREVISIGLPAYLISEPTKFPFRWIRYSEFNIAPYLSNIDPTLREAEIEIDFLKGLSF
jgi:hypothetical protein